MFSLFSVCYLIFLYDMSAGTFLTTVTTKHRHQVPGKAVQNVSWAFPSEFVCLIICTVCSVLSRVFPPTSGCNANFWLKILKYSNFNLYSSKYSKKVGRTMLLWWSLSISRRKRAVCSNRSQRRVPVQIRISPSHTFKANATCVLCSEWVRVLLIDFLKTFKWSRCH